MVLHSHSVSQGKKRSVSNSSSWLMFQFWLSCLLCLYICFIWFIFLLSHHNEFSKKDKPDDKVLSLGTKKRNLTRQENTQQGNSATSENIKPEGKKNAIKL